jgi:hypothetical protein
MFKIHTRSVPTAAATVAAVTFATGLAVTICAMFDSYV